MKTETRQSLSEWLDEMLRSAGPGSSGRVRIRDGAPDRLRYSSRASFRKHVHAQIRYRHGRIVFRSSHVTDEVLAACVARAEAVKNGWSVSVYIPHGRYHRREQEPEQSQDTAVPAPACSYDTYDELPFN